MVSFLEVWLFVKDEIEKFYDPTKWTSPGMQKEPGQGDDSWIDINAVTEAVRGELFSSLGLVVDCSNQPAEEIRHFSRGCPCHRQTSLAQDDSDEDSAHQDTFNTCHKRRARIRKETGVDHPCVAKGMVLPFLACGDGELIVRRARLHM